MIMSKSFKLFNGDLSITNRSFDIVSGQDKLLQDLSLWMRERIGTDPMTPTFGSMLDGGIVNGQEVTPFIGQNLSPDIKGRIASSVFSQLQLYQQLQLEKIKAEAIQYNGRNTLERGEVISSIDSVDVSNIGSVVVIKVLLTTLANKSVQLTLPLDTGIN